MLAKGLRRDVHGTELAMEQEGESRHSSPTFPVIHQSTLKEDRTEHGRVEYYML